MKKCISALALIFVCGCASGPQIPADKVQINFTSEPIGAMIYHADSGQAYGMSPTGWIYPLKPQMLAAGYGFANVTAVWPSGQRERNQ